MIFHEFIENLEKHSESADLRQISNLDQILTQLGRIEDMDIPHKSN